MGSERHYELRFGDERRAIAALTEGLQRSPYTGQTGKPSNGREGCAAYFVTFDDDGTSDASSSAAFFADLAARHGGKFVGVA